MRNRLKDWAIQSEARMGVYFGFLWASLILFFAMSMALLYLAVFQNQLWAWIPLLIAEVAFIWSLWGTER